MLGCLVALLWKTGFFQSVSSVEAIQAYIERFSPYSHFIFFLLQLISVLVAPIPSNLSAAAGAVLFGFVWASLLTLSAVLLGSVIVFSLARKLGKSFADRCVDKRLSKKYLDVIRKKQDVFLALAFFLPFFPDDILCILAGLTDISLKRFFIIALLTRPWGLLVACAIGSSTLSVPTWALLLMGGAGLALFFLGMKYGDRLEGFLLKKFSK